MNQARECAGIDWIETPPGRLAWRNAGETVAFYAASRMSQLRKSSSAASQLRKINRINYLQVWPCDTLVSLVSSVTCNAQAALDDVRNWLRLCLSR